MIETNIIEENTQIIKDSLVSENNINKENIIFSNEMKTFSQLHTSINGIYSGVANKNLKERIEWAITKPNDIVKKIGETKKQQREKLQNDEKKWGNNMIGQVNNGQWTTLLGERLVYDVLVLLGENPRKPQSKGNFQPDWEGDKYIYEVKTSNWWVDGTAGEKVLGTFIKYQDIPELYEKPLKIICVAYQEYELTHGKTKYFGENITDKTQKILDMASSWNIEYVKFSDLSLPVLSKL